MRKGLQICLVSSPGVDYAAMKEKAVDNTADMVRKHLDMDFIRRNVGL